MFSREEILSSADNFCRFIEYLSRYNITNRSGSAFRSHPKCYWKDGILLINHWNVHDYCGIRIASDRDANCIRGCQDSRAHGNAYPRVDRGELVSVWSDGKWTKTGPWMESIEKLIDDLIETLELKIEQEKKQKEEERMQRETERRAREEILRKAWLY